MHEQRYIRIAHGKAPLEYQLHTAPRRGLYTSGAASALALIYASITSRTAAPAATATSGIHNAGKICVWL